MQFEPKIKNYKQKVEDSFKLQKFMDFIGAKLVKVEPGFCEIHLPYNENLTQQNGYFHAGIISALADNAAGYASLSLMEEDSSVLSVEFKLNLTSPGIGDLLIARANVLKSGRTLSICRSDVFAVKNGVEKLCAASQATLIQVKKE
ncbi:PaaI family thioesterase [Gillisia sp. CAL575]|uniref:PaaI family thioesterase n=1 Tax=Gillisia sp. CAL575 TaxID=985255 RepID=UPI0003A9B51A|nr:PaaI family thioesterase [Gillisia sp. CAL575]